MRLVKEHLALAREELRRDVRVAGRNVALALLGMPLALVGWALLMGALAVALTPLVGLAGGLALVGGINLIAGTAISAVFGLRLVGRDRPALSHVAQELEEDRRWLQTLARSRTADTTAP